ncbi:MAG: esterase-like activity of phytase family protein [Gammaproteobacteria bacterium]
MPRPTPLNPRDTILMRFPVLCIALSLVSALAPAPRIACAAGHDDGHAFQRIATFPVFLNSEEGAQTGAEIVSASENGKLLVYTDSQSENLGFVDIDQPGAPKPRGVVAMSGEPTSVAVSGPYALAVVDTSASFSDPSGQLVVVNLKTRDIVRRIGLGGQPDSIAVSPDRRYAAITIENERDEEAGDGRPPQSPPGFVVIVDLQGRPAAWGIRKVGLVGIPGLLFPDDPEPEFVDINDQNIAAVTLQENNHVVLIDLPTGKILRHWDAGTADLRQVDVLENDLIELDGELHEVPREPDGVTWISPFRLATADEGDLDGGSRGFTIFDGKGEVRFAAGNALEHRVTRIGHYPEDRSENKGNEPEGMEYGQYGRDRFLFVGSERSNIIAVYQIILGRPKLVQVLPAGVGPESVLAIPSRGLLVVASEVDDAGANIRSTITIYALEGRRPRYPTIRSANRAGGLPIPWGALSALVADRWDPHTLYTVYDSFYRESRIFTLDIRRSPAVITDELVLRRDGETVDLDLEGIAQRPDRGFWAVSEGAGSVDDPDRPVSSMNLLIKTTQGGAIVAAINLPNAVNALQRRFGFEGVASVGRGAKERVYVAFQREWVGDPGNRVRIGRYDTATGEWRFFYYPLDLPTSPAGGWVGLSELVALGGETFAVIERDNQAGTNARIKRIYRFSIAGLEPQAQGGAFPLVVKTLVRDLMPDLERPKGLVLEKVEGLAVNRSGRGFIVTDNDGVVDSSGETQFLRLGAID